jgi:hypothetical protein
MVEAREEIAAPVTTATQDRATMLAPSQAAAERGGGLRASLLSLQRTAGNRATGALLRSQGLASVAETRADDRNDTRRPDARVNEPTSTQLKRALQRTASGRPAGPAARRSNRVVLAEIRIGGPIGSPAPVLQRSETAPASPVRCDPSAASCQPAPAHQPIRRVDDRSVGPITVDAAGAREIVDAYVRAFSSLQGAVLAPWPSGGDRVAANEPAPGPTLATWPSDRKLARSPGLEYHFLGGFVGSLQLCYDLCTAELGLVGWIWAVAAWRRTTGSSAASSGGARTCSPSTTSAARRWTSCPGSAAGRAVPNACRQSTGTPSGGPASPASRSSSRRASARSSRWQVSSSVR